MINFDPDPNHFDQDISRRGADREIEDVEQWIQDLWRERANPLTRNGHQLDEIFWKVVDVGVLRAVHEPWNRARIADGLYGIAEQYDRFGRSHDALLSKMADRFKSFEKFDRAKLQPSDHRYATQQQRCHTD